FHRVEAGLQGEVGVDDGGVDVGQGPGQHGRLQLPEAKALGVLHDVEDGGLKACTRPQGDEPRLLQQQEGAAAVGHVVGNRELRAVGQLVEAGDAGAVEADGLAVHLQQHLEVEAVVGAEGFKVRDVLEVVGVQLAVAQRQVGKDIVVEHHDLEIDALGGQVDRKSVV